MNNKYKYMVCIECMTYNHGQYIKATMDGFVIQKTTFPYVALIVDDASTDNNSDVILKYISDNFCDVGLGIASLAKTDYGKVVVARHKTNNNCTFVFVHLNQNHYSIKKDKECYLKEWASVSKYRAFCEGDDFWIDSQKLQKQVDIMESDDEYGLTYSNANIYYQTTGKCFKGNSLPYKDLKSMLYSNPVMTLTTLIRNDLYEDYLKEIEPNTKNWMLGDYPLWIWLAAHSKLAFIDDITATYRVLQNSASHSQNVERQVAMYKSDYDVQVFFLNKYRPNDNDLRLKIEDKKNRRIAEAYYAHGIRKEYLHYLRSISEKTLKEKLKIVMFSIAPIFALRMKMMACYNKK